MEIICHLCQGVIEVDYKMVYKIDEDYFITFCPGCDAENEVWDVYDWFSPYEIDYIEDKGGDQEEDDL